MESNIIICIPTINAVHAFSLEMVSFVFYWPHAPYTNSVWNNSSFSDTAIYRVSVATANECPKTIICMIKDIRIFFSPCTTRACFMLMVLSIHEKKLHRNSHAISALSAWPIHQLMFVAPHYIFLLLLWSTSSRTKTFKAEHIWRSFGQKWTFATATCYWHFLWFSMC